MNRETLAAIDIGSNAIRLLIDYIENDRESVEFKKAAFIRVPIRLGEDVFTAGEVSEEKRNKLSEAMLAFSQLMTTFNVRKYRACATSAMRDARNGADIVAHIQQTTGINIDIISGKEEAKTIFEAGDIAGLMNKDQSYLFVDVGGGSTEITIYSNHQRVDSVSFPLGTVRLISNAVHKDEMKRFKEWLKEYALPHNPVSIIGSGGNINKVAKMLERRAPETLKYNEVKELYDNLKQMTFEQRVRELRLNVYRADVIMPAMKIFLTVAKTCKINDILVPKLGLADGIIHKLYHEDL